MGNHAFVIFQDLRLIQCRLRVRCSFTALCVPSTQLSRLEKLQAFFNWLTSYKLLFNWLKNCMLLFNWFKRYMLLFSASVYLNDV